MFIDKIFEQFLPERVEQGEIIEENKCTIKFFIKTWDGNFILKFSKQFCSAEIAYMRNKRFCYLGDRLYLDRIMKDLYSFSYHKFDCTVLNGNDYFQVSPHKKNETKIVRVVRRKK